MFDAKHVKREVQMNDQAFDLWCSQCALLFSGAILMRRSGVLRSPFHIRMLHFALFFQARFFSISEEEKGFHMFLLKRWRLRKEKNQPKVTQDRIRDLC